MTITSQTNKILYAGNGAQTVFPYPFKVFEAQDLVVIRRAANGAQTSLVPGAHYKVSGVGAEAGGAVTLLGPQAAAPPGPGEKLLIKRVVPVTQNTDWVDNDPFPAAVIENAVDRLVCIAQQQEETLGRCLKVGETSSLSGLIDPDQLAADAWAARDNAQASALSAVQAQAVLAQTQAVQVQTRADIAALRIGQPGGVAGLDASGLVPAGQILSVLRDSRAGAIVEWEAAVIPILADGLPLGLELDGSLASLGTYPRLARVWCGADANAAAPAWYKCNADGARNASGAYIRLQDRRGEFVRGFDHGRGVDAGRTLASAQAEQFLSHQHSVPYSMWTYPSVGNPDAAGYQTLRISSGDVLIGTGANGGSETRPRNIAAMYLILV